ncbi:SGNH/GDSL hydrolase family protein [Cellulomonas sp. KRMCY2]|uniref:SGNH/GDSL hydrolase family protein n=1 Tax=Cellulomonas sp. KRMCY2 TaxID=1304865 RepID=UPI00045E9832|nr:SGNH/GDSL hydrolase family protein [Cellulomonas sp. KRMCY2]
MYFTRSDSFLDAVPVPAEPPHVPWRRFAALGDSFTEGLWDVPGGEPPTRTAATDPAPTCRGWADLLALHLAERAEDGRLEYANLAVRGRLLGPILREQVPAALSLEPDLVSLIGGGNDILRPAADPDRLAAQLERAVVALRAAGVDVLLGTGMDSKDSPVVRRTRGRAAVLNAHIWSIARRHDAHVLDLWGMRSLRDWRMWAPDRIHLTTEGHRRVAQGALAALGLEPDDPAWDDPLAPLPPLPRAAQVRDDIEWFRSHAYPWATRRLRGRSSGDERTAKRPKLTPLG